MYRLMSWLPEYIETHLQRDVRSLVNIGDLERFARFLFLATGRVGQPVNCPSLANDAGTSVDTIRGSISVLKTGFVILLLKRHDRRNLNKHLIDAEPAMAYFHHRRQRPPYFRRNRTGHEIDLIVEEGGVWYPVEIKAGT